MGNVHHAQHDHHDHHDHDHHHGPKPGIMRWLTTTNHKDIGAMYLWFSFIMFLTGGFLAMLIRAELMYPGLQLLEPDFFNQMTTSHGIRWLRQHLGADDDRCARHGASPVESLEFLDSSVCLCLVGVCANQVGPGDGCCTQLRLDVLCTVVHQVRPSVH